MLLALVFLFVLGHTGKNRLALAKAVRRLLHRSHIRVVFARSVVHVRQLLVPISRGRVIVWSTLRGKVPEVPRSLFEGTLCVDLPRDDTLFSLERLRRRLRVVLVPFLATSDYENVVFFVHCEHILRTCANASDGILS